MQSYFIEKDDKIKIDIEADPSNISIIGTIDNIDDTLFEVLIEGTYIQNTIRNATCIIPGDIKTLRFETIILGSKNDRLFLALPSTDRIECLQRRKHVRSPIDLFVNCCFVGFNEAKLDINQYYSVRLVDISVGGVRLRSQDSIPLGSILVFEIMLDNEPMMLTVKVIRCTESHDKKNYDIGCQFMGLDSNDEQKISAFCLKLQNRNNREQKIQRR